MCCKQLFASPSSQKGVDARYKREDTTFVWLHTYILQYELE